MAQISLQALKDLWINGFKPTAQSFSDLFDSFVHKDAPINELVPRATQAEAEAGTDNEKVMTPLTTFQAIAEERQGYLASVPDFPAGFTLSGGSSILNTYEEGTWSPRFNDSDGNVGNTIGSGEYVKVGRVCTCIMILDDVDKQGLSNLAGVRIAGLPFVSSGFDDQYIGAPFHEMLNVTGGQQQILQVLKSDARLRVWYITDNGSATPGLIGDNTDDQTNYRFTFSYITA